MNNASPLREVVQYRGGAQHALESFINGKIYTKYFFPSGSGMTLNTVVLNLPNAASLYAVLLVVVTCSPIIKLLLLLLHL